MSTTSVLNSLPTKQIENTLINGCFEYWQRGTSFAAIANGAYSSDRWRFASSGTVAVNTTSRDTDVPTSAFGVYSLNATITTAAPTVPAGQLVAFTQYVEGTNLRKIKGKNLLLQFWVKSPKTGIHCLAFSNSGDTRCLVKEYTINVANTWELKQIRFNHNTAGSWNYDTSLGLTVNFILSAGSTYHGIKDVWSSSTFFATSNQVNALDTIGNSFKLADVMLVEDNFQQNSTPTFTLAGENLAEELILCQRYYEKSYQGVPAGTIVGQGCAVIVATTLENNGMGGMVQYKVTKRVGPTVTIYSPLSGLTTRVADIQNTVDEAANSGVPTFAGADGFVISQTTGVAITSNRGFNFHWTSDAEL